jgi:hypothetical protein
MLRKEGVDWAVMNTMMNFGNFLTNRAIISFPRESVLALGRQAKTTRNGRQ